jgi:hypothetical protein
MSTTHSIRFPQFLTLTTVASCGVGYPAGSRLSRRLF